MGNRTAVSTFLLWGFSSFPELQHLLCVVIFLSHVAILLANACIMVAIRLNRSLHKPMYIFLFGLSLSETCATMVIVPRMLADLLSASKTISLPECATQMLFFFALAANDCLVLCALSYDRHTAIRSPLRSHSAVTPEVCLRLLAASRVLGCLISLGITATVFNLSFCDSNSIQHFFCDISPVVHLAWDYTPRHEITILVLSAFVLVGSFILIMISYVFIGSLLVKIPSAKGRCKAFSTCSSHGFAGFVYLKPRNSDSFREDMLMAVTYMVLTPLLNPIVYSLRNKEMQTALRKVLGSVVKIMPHLTNKKALNI